MAEAARTRVPSQDRAVRTRAALVEAAAHEFSRNGYAATTAKTIAERAKSATGSFYQYFTDKDAVLREIAATRQAALVEQALQLLAHVPPKGDPAAQLRDMRARIRAVVDAVIAYHAEDPG